MNKTFRLLYAWPDGQQLGFEHICNGIWQHVHRDSDGKERQVGPQYPTKDALSFDSSRYQAEIWGIHK